MDGDWPGDANQDGTPDLSDGVWLPSDLFVGGVIHEELPFEGGTSSRPGPGEPTLLDSNGDGRLDGSDAVSVLSFLFLAQKPSPVLGTSCAGIPGCRGACTGP